MTARSKILPPQSIPSSRTRDAVDPPDLPGDGDDVRGVPDELERSWPVQTVRDDGEGAVPFDLYERAGVWLQPENPQGHPATPALRERVETMTAAKFHVDEEGGAGGHLLNGTSFFVLELPWAGLALIPQWGNFSSNETTLPFCG